MRNDKKEIRMKRRRSKIENEEKVKRGEGGGERGRNEREDKKN